MQKNDFSDECAFFNYTSYALWIDQVGSFLSILKVLNKREGDLSCPLKPFYASNLGVVFLHKIFEAFSSNGDAVRSAK